MQYEQSKRNIKAVPITKAEELLGIKAAEKFDLSSLINYIEKSSKKGRDSLPMKDGKDATGGWPISGFSAFCFTNSHGERWVCYVSVDHNDVWFSGSEVSWEWKRVVRNPKGTLKLYPWILASDEKEFMDAVCNISSAWHSDKAESVDSSSFPVPLVTGTNDAIRFCETSDEIISPLNMEKI